MNEAIESVFAQTYYNWELLLVDDGSTDKSTQIAKEFAQRHPDKIFYLEHEGHKNKGITASRNLAISQCNGEFVALLDSDDIWLPGKLETQVKIAEKHPDVGFIVNPSFYWHHNENKKFPQPMTIALGYHAPGGIIDKMIENHDNVACTCGVLIRKSDIIKIGGFDETAPPLFEEAGMWFRISLVTSTYYDTECVALMRIRSSSFFNKSTYTDRLLGRIQYYSWITDLLKKKDSSLFASEQLLVSIRILWSLFRWLRHAREFESAVALAEFIEQQGRPMEDAVGEWDFMVGECLQNLEGRRLDAINRFTRSLEMGFDAFFVLHYRGALFLELGKLDQAEADLSHALELKPTHEGVLHLLQELQQKRRS